ncbi:ribonuclease J [Mycoplasmoides genitalium]|uniref:Ribonuclease J n=2 Tax=Mycoplasmoides genitalium TaxID=2097 RepID=RNJ_MYCGE|nr:ribonuclease J [Mycoplasmoides genitalium]P47385.1 RecName: Full=Ribonuclease J; Short=RNase J [Mycoplasmoides genitalium G37]ABY79573.1 metallo-beta-lactamase superfamily protein [synthetic Mycoplasma genitalium JCVI-1.0]AAC71357.1 metallo-beta-lactamase superfamily protein [Mycoplasmoides genitalium G37]AFQ02957.1 metallo-beta-lactamase superfamily protein [Mycoplasmoides genitalium M2321]AFQ03444.1 metallo-beta-lactamase superfamily protein [Mycoplasmoides genitalium M6282]AFQ03947.1 me
MIKDFNPGDFIGKKPTKIYAFGGIQEVGKNMYGIEYDDEIIIIDCGIKFASDDLLGINGIIPSFEHLIENQSKVKALFITHGHEDHIGGVPYLLKQVDIPVIYAPRIAASLILKKVNEHKDAKLNKIVTFDDFSEFQTKHFKIDFYRVNHSIPDAFGICVQTPNGNIVQSGDYRFDFAAGSEMLDVHKVVKIAERNVHVFMSESTNAEVPGFSQSEKLIYRNIQKILKEARGRVILTTFASNITRINEIIEIALNNKRKICLLGKSMDVNVNISRKIGLMAIDSNDIVEVRDIKNYPDRNILILCTGSQGEEAAALNTMARGKHNWVSLKSTDTIIMSSNPIPGNYAAVENLLNELSKFGVAIYENSSQLKLHASGHATQQELQLMLNLMFPKYLIPIHGEFKMMRTIKNIANECGIKSEDVALLSNGQVMYLIDEELYYSNEIINADPIYIESHNSSPDLARIIKQRQILSRDGMFAVIVVFDKNNNIIGIPTLITRGCFFALDSNPLMTKIAHSVKRTLESVIQSKKFNSHEQLTKELKRVCKETVSYFIWKNKNRNPLISTVLSWI